MSFQYKPVHPEDSDPVAAVTMSGSSRLNASPSGEQGNALVRLLKKMGCSPGEILLSLKGAIPPIIAIAAYQAKAYADLFTTIGYFIAIIALLSMANQPRAKFFQSIFTNAVFICFISALNLLVILCAVKVRDPKNNKGLHVGASSSIESTAYDSSANAVAGTWLFVIVFLSNYLKSKRPQLAVPAIQSNIYSITAAVYAPSFPDMEAGMAFTKRLLSGFLLAYALAAGVNVFIFPTTTRGEVKRQSAALICSLKDCIQTYKTYIDTFDKKMKADENPADVIKTLKEQSRGTSDKFGKIKLTLDFARKELAYGKLAPEHLHDLYVGMREVLQPIMGLSTFLEIIADVHHNDMSAESAGSEAISSSQILEAIQNLNTDEWAAIVMTFRDSHGQLQESMCQALDHIAMQLELMSRPKTKQTDIEHSMESEPGNSSFAKHLEQELRQYQTRHDRLVQEWLDPNQSGAQRGPPVPRTLSEESDVTRAGTTPKQHQLYLIMYLNFLLYNTARAILRQVRFADKLVADGTMKRNRIIFPGCRTTASLMMGAFMDVDQDEAMGANANNGANIWVGDLFNRKKDPEHLPASNVYEKCTDILRRIPESLSSPHAVFGLRCAVATFSLAIIAFLAQTRQFFLDQRGIWAASTTAIAMSPSLGASVSAFMMRLGGTAAAAGLSIAICYIADHNTAGIIVLLYVLLFIGLLLISRFPSFESAGIIGTVALIVIVGYELQVQVIGIARATDNGEVYYPVYLLAPYRLGAICAGVAVAFFWSFFPFPITSHGSLRQDTANTLYILANYHSCVHATLDIYLRYGPEVNKLHSDHPVSRLEDARQEVFGKSILMLGRLRDHVHASKFEPRIGGKFPRDQYEQVIESLSYIFTYLALMTYSSKAFIRDSEYVSATGEPLTESEIEFEQEWLKTFRSSVANTHVTSQKLTSVLILLAASIHNGQPLPPYLALSRQNDPAEKLPEVVSDIMDMRHFSHPCYAAFAVNEITGSLVNGELAKLIKLVKELVGEVDFTFHIMSTSDDSTSTLVDSHYYSKEGDEATDVMKMKGS